MNREEAKGIIISEKSRELHTYGKTKFVEALDVAIKALEQEPCEDAISRQAVKEQMIKYGFNAPDMTVTEFVEALPSVSTEKTGRCKDCKYFEYDSVAKVDGIPLIVAHEICSRWGRGCMTMENGYCFLYEPQESEDKE